MSEWWDPIEVKEKKKRASKKLLKSKTLLLGYSGCGVFLIGTFLLAISAIFIDIDNKSGAGFTFLLLGALVCSLGLLLQLLIWVINLFLGGINFLAWGLKFHMPRTQGKGIKNQGKLKE